MYISAVCRKHKAFYRLHDLGNLCLDLHSLLPQAKPPSMVVKDLEFPHNQNTPTFCYHDFLNPQTLLSKQLQSKTLPCTFNITIASCFSPKAEACRLDVKSLLVWSWPTIKNREELGAVSLAFKFSPQKRICMSPFKMGAPMKGRTFPCTGRRRHKGRTVARGGAALRKSFGRRHKALRYTEHS